MFFEGKDSVAPEKRTSEDAEKLKKLEELLEANGILKTEKAKLDRLCSASYRACPVEPPQMTRRPSSAEWERGVGGELMRLMAKLDKEHPSRTQRRSKKGECSGSQQVKSRKRSLKRKRSDIGTEPTSGEVDAESR